MYRLLKNFLSKNICVKNIYYCGQNIRNIVFPFGNTKLLSYHKWAILEKEIKIKVSISIIESDIYRIYIDWNS